MKAKKSLGQNFLQDLNIINTIAEDISAFSNDLIIEIGPGRGALTCQLIKKNSYYLGYEIDTDLKNILKDYNNEKQKIIFQDFLKANVKEDIKNYNYDKLYIVGNLPYYITSAIIEKIISLDLIIEKVVIMVQKEVALRFMGQVHTKDYGYFTLFLKYYFDIFKVCDVKNTSFNPIPKVDSIVIELIPRKNRIELDIKKYQQFLKDCFKQKRKTLKNNLEKYDWEKINKILNKHNLLPNVRAEELSEDILIEIFKEIG